MELACLNFQASSLCPVRLKSSKATSHGSSLASLSSGKSSNSSRIRCLSSTFSSCAALGVNLVRRRQQFSLAAVVGDKTVVSDNCDEKKVSSPDSAGSLPINDEVTRDGDSESEGSVEGSDINKMIRVCDKLIEVFLVDKPTPTDWRRLLTFSMEWNNIQPHFFQRCQDRAELEGDPGMKHKLLRLGRKLKEIDEDVQRHNELLEVIMGAPLEINEIVAKRRKDFTKEFFVHIHTVAESYYDNPTEQNAVAKLGNTCLAAVQAYDTAAENIEAINAAELKFQDIINSPSIDVACRKIDSLAEKNQLDSALMLMITKAWSAVKESNMTKDEVKDILYHLYMTARGNLQRLLPKEIRIVKYLLTIEDPEERLCALNDAFTPGEELEGVDVDNLYTTPEKLHTMMRAVVDAYNFSQEGTLLREARDLMNPKIIQKLEELIKIVEKNFM
ncbi:putative F-box/LRR-repeat protein [Hibiscus syriacus]|uniref:F-box/LRR-repeat protein n=1 Tax=Hibiscus syriacus TaxID=106335 RepID=A0A6A3BJ49_HIBSY|nr:uncharacterized protein At4g37920-like [Hibiscus syriacus]KAE8715438.1 putative F-box/LRR-repeat protein [Hibiscus syriacus]